MADDADDLYDWNPFDKIEEDRDVLEAIAAARLAAQDKQFPKHLLTTDPAVNRAVILRSKAECAEEARRDYSVPPVEMPARLATGDEWPRAAKTLLKKLDGWSADGWIMRGPVISSQNRERTIKTCFALKADHDDGRKIRVTFFAKDDGKWDRGNNWMWLPVENVPWKNAASVKMLEAYVASSSDDFADDYLLRPEPIPLEEL